MLNRLFNYVIILTYIFTSYPHLSCFLMFILMLLLTCSCLYTHTYTFIYTNIFKLSHTYLRMIIIFTLFFTTHIYNMSLHAFYITNTCLLLSYKYTFSFSNCQLYPFIPIHIYILNLSCLRPSKYQFNILII